MNIELFEKLIEGYKELLDICKHQALLIEQHDLISIDDALSTRGQLIKLEDNINSIEVTCVPDEDEFDED